MNIPLLALTVRSLREDARSYKTHLWRAGLVAVMFFALSTAQALSTIRSAQGLSLFAMITYLNLFLIAFFAGTLFAATITEEKEAGSLGLLKLTGLSPLSILLGKSAGLYVTTAILLAIQLPFMFLAVTLGGISPRQIAAAYVLLAAFAVFMGGLGLLGSVLFDRAKSAWRFVSNVLVVYYALPFIGVGVLALVTHYSYADRPPAYIIKLGEIFRTARLGSVVEAAMEILSTGFAGPVVDTTVIVNIAFGLAFFGLAWWAFERATRTEKPPAPERPALIRRSRLSGPRGQGGASGARAWNDALAWKDFRFIAGGVPGLVWWSLIYAAIIIVPVIATVWIARTWGEEVEWDTLSWVGLIVPLVLLPLQMGMLAAKFLAEERRWGTLSNMALLPMTIGSAAYAKARGAAMQLLPGLAALVIGFVWCAIADGAALAETLGDVISELPAWYTVATVVFAIHLAAYLSLFVKRGAFALTVAAIWTGNWIIALFFARGVDDEAFFGVMIVALLVGSFLLHPWIGRRLESLAAAEG